MENHIRHVVAGIVDAVLEAFLEVRVDSLQHRSVNLCDFHANCVLQVVQSSGLLLVYSSLEVSP